MLGSDSRNNTALFRLFSYLNTPSVTMGPPSGPTAGKPASVIVFISQINAADVSSARADAHDITAAGVQITIVALGSRTQSDIQLLQTLTPNLVIQWDLTQSTPDGWLQKFQSAYGCGGMFRI